MLSDNNHANGITFETAIGVEAPTTTLDAKSRFTQKFKD
jgi:hypothetical protein